ncbi:hypothetical protein SLS58_006310 [Diplodia intermedia]|uniref:Uncharacterized protein n=1 Tax=Diplodia intermedia TaxID=856260 RepID=A0ABR3TNK1_9PEZI
MAPRIPPPAQGNAAARNRAHFTARPEAIVHTSKMFKNHAQHTTTARSKAAPLTKYDLTSKPHGVTKSRSHGRGLPRRTHKPEHPLSTLFDESSDFYRSTIINTAQDSLFATRRALIYRLTSTNGPGEQQQQQQQRFPTTAARSPSSNGFSFSPASNRASSPPNRLPTAAELQAAHNAAVANVTAPFGDTPVVKGGGGGGGGKLDAAAAAGGGKEKEEKKADDAVLAPDLHSEQPLSALMADFAAVVAREEKKLFELGGRWMQTQAEIRLLAEDIFGKEAVRDMMKGRNVDREVAEVGRGLAEEEVEALKGMVDVLVEETAKEAVEVREKERSVKRDQKKMILATVKRIEEL